MAAADSTPARFSFGKAFMAQKHRFRQRANRGNRKLPPASPPAERRPVVEKKPPVIYSQPITILEDEAKNTFEFQQGAWVPFPMSIAESRRECLVKELPQKVNRMTRYELRCPVDRTI
jgi:hypothetical protein